MKFLHSPDPNCCMKVSPVASGTARVTITAKKGHPEVKICRALPCFDIRGLGIRTNFFLSTKTSCFFSFAPRHTKTSSIFDVVVRIHSCRSVNVALFVVVTNQHLTMRSLSQLWFHLLCLFMMHSIFLRMHCHVQQI